MKQNRIVVNRWMTPDGTILESKHQHDFVSHTDADGVTYFVDGGIGWYYRVSIGLTSLCLYEDDPHEEIRKVFTWGTYGKLGNEPKKYVKLQEMTTEHIEAILSTQWHIRGSIVVVVFKNELEYRKLNKE